MNNRRPSEFDGAAKPLGGPGGPQTGTSPKNQGNLPQWWRRRAIWMGFPGLLFIVAAIFMAQTVRMRSDLQRVAERLSLEQVALRDLQSTNKQLRDSNKQLSDATSRLATQQEQLQAAVNSLDTARKQLEGTNTSLTKQQEGLQAAVNGLDTKRKQLEGTNNSLTKQQEGLQATVNGLDAKRKQLEGTNNSLTKQQEGLQAAVNGLDTTRKQLESTTKGLGSELEAQVKLRQGQWTEIVEDQILSILEEKQGAGLGRDEIVKAVQARLPAIRDEFVKVTLKGLVAKRRVINQGRTEAYGDYRLGGSGDR